jgi:hypothetical protein
VGHSDIKLNAGTLWRYVCFSFLILLIIEQTHCYIKLDAISLSATLFIVIPIITVPGLLLHIKYYKYDKGKSLKFRPIYFEITQKKKSDKICYKDILRIKIHHSTWSYKNPWSEYGYIKIVLKDNSIFSYSCLTHDFRSIPNIFQRNGAMVIDCGEFYRW